MYTAPAQSYNPLEKLPYNLRCSLASFVDSNKDKYNTVSAFDRASDFARSVLADLNLPYDIKNYLDKAAAARLKKHGLKRALAFIERRSQQTHANLGMIPEPWYRVDSEYKRARLADELAGRASLHLDLAHKAGKTPLEALEEINEYTGLSLWVPQYAPTKRDLDDDFYLGLIARSLDDSVWLKAINQGVTIAFESARRAAGMVSPHVSPYASYSACEWLKERQKKQADWIESMTLKSECGEELELKDVHAASNANQVNRRNELMTQLRGLQEYADASGHIALFGTLTAAGRYHRLKKHGKYFIENQNWNGEYPVAAHEWISTSWKRFRSAADKLNLTYYGMRVVEPHVDGTPHWHGVFFVPKEQVKTFTQLLTDYQCQRDEDELVTKDNKPKYSAIKARCKIDEIDRSKGDAVSYIAKYISKNIDGHKLTGSKDLDSNLVDLVESIVNVTAWSRAYRFRQFQFQKTPSVTVWRELRRIKDKQEFGLFEKIRLAADCGCFASYFTWMGGHETRQRSRPLSLNYIDDENCYGETITKTVGVRGAGHSVLTHEKKWELIKKEKPKTDLNALAMRHFRAQNEALVSGSLVSEESGGSRFPWTSVNNCTQPPNDEDIRAYLGANEPQDQGWCELFSNNKPKQGKTNGNGTTKGSKRNRYADYRERGSLHQLTHGKGAQALGQCVN